MPAIDTALRLIIIGQEILIAAILLTGRGSTAARLCGALLVLSVAAYMVVSDPVIDAALAPVLPALILLAMVVPYSLWLFARAFFEAPWPHPLVIAAFAIAGLVAWLLTMLGEYSAFDYGVQSNLAFSGIKLVVVLHTLWMTLQGRPDDLVERRRAFRMVFVWLIAIQVVAVLSVELVFEPARPPAWLELINLVAIAALTIGLAIPLLRPSADIFPAEDRDEERAALVRREHAGNPADELLRRALLELMAAGHYRTTGLTIRSLADHMKAPEHQLRRLINGQLGFRNFSAFVNSFRIAEAREKLADPKYARTPVLTLALDLGYASLGPFNRAFKAQTGTTPSDFRFAALSRRIAESE